MRTIILVLVLVVLVGLACARPAPAQSLPSDTFFVFSPPMLGRNAHIYRIAADARILNTVAVLPPNFTPTGMTMAPDNQSVRVVGWLPQLLLQSFVLEVSPLGKITTLYFGSQTRIPYHSFPDDDGNWVVVDEAVFGQQLGTRFWRLAPGGLTSLGALPQHLVYGLARDPGSNRMICRTSTYARPLAYAYLRVDHRTGQFAPVTAIPALTFPGKRGAAVMPYEPASGAMVDVSMPSGLLALWRIDRASGMRPFSSVNFQAVPMDLTQASQRTAGIAYYVLGQIPVHPMPNGLFHVDRNGRLQTFHLNRTTSWRDSPLVREGSRHLHWTLDFPPNGRSLRLSFPGEGGRPYVALVSHTGTRPGVPLPDGRFVGIVPDGFTHACLAGGIPGYITHTVGVLDSAGRAVVAFNANPLRGAARGLRFWAAVLVLDPKAPSGVAWVTDPVTVTLK